MAETINPTTYLRRDNPRLLELQDEYSKLTLPFGHTQWKDHQNNVGVHNFRYDGHYLGTGAMWDDAYRIMFDHVVRIDKKGWLRDLQEDDAFGIQTYEFPMPDGTLKVISRDLLDSIMELYAVMESYGGLPQRWLDIGAGYGRFAHRLTNLPGWSGYITCIDPIAVSTFLCEFYMAYRDCTKSVETLPMSYIDDIQADDFDIAVNIHSWSECSANAINFWLDRLCDWRVPYLFLVPHDERLVCVNEDGSIGNFYPLLEKHGYHNVWHRSKYPEGVNGLYPEVNYHLFVRRP